MRLKHFKGTCWDTHEKSLGESASEPQEIAEWEGWPPYLDEQTSKTTGPRLQSRQVGPRLAKKLTGKERVYAGGAATSQHENPAEQLGRDNTNTRQKVRGAVLRLKKKCSEEAFPKKNSKGLRILAVGGV